MARPSKIRVAVGGLGSEFGEGGIATLAGTDDSETSAIARQLRGVP